MSYKNHPMIGKKIVLRGKTSGVYIGTVVSVAKYGTELKDSQRVWSWSGDALDTFALAQTGPKTAKLSPVVQQSVVIRDAREHMAMSDEAILRFEEIGPWRG